MTAYLIPLRPQSERFGVALGGVTYTLTLTWRATTWIMDIADVGGAPILSGLPLVVGVDLLAQYAYLAFGGGLYVLTDSASTPPSYAGLGTQARLYWVSP